MGQIGIYNPTYCENKKGTDRINYVLNTFQTEYNILSVP